ncbi:MAG: 16S rRNA (cytosine(967)-C(5))-methyltransferase RsmB [Candidatus Tectomicrobia bacterium]|uniref:16S rRNA (cytosine(967)-C(5))-methyltransferase n=1 Tax=Tectimicrobiota bacterium TaxID=2528274 RepID=A0A932G111_UNCTE|nr:16S rRNA (cytosine(967)-C(5))-methyltransferase RsmB [Candidatus Tectomicrobia bacterium]
MKQQEIKKTARAYALELLHRVETQRNYAAPLLNRLLEREEISPPDKGLIHELVYGVLRWRNRLDWMIRNCASRPMEEMTSWIRNILRLGVYQLAFTQKIPAAAAVHESVNLAYRYGHRGTAGFVNAILREVQRRGATLAFPDAAQEPSRFLAIYHSHPQWLIERWLGRYGPEWTAQICQANNTPPPLTIRTNTLLTTRESLKLALIEAGVTVEECLLAPEGLRIASPVPIPLLSAFQQGWFQVQDESSILMGHLLAPQPGQRILDACAGLGGKATHLAQRMENRGEVLALDINPQKLAALEESCLRLGVTIVRGCLADATRWETEIGGFDGLLVDAPCSSLGVIRRHPEIRWLKEESDIYRLQALQFQLLESVADRLAPGGYLLYCTCSFEPEETLAVVQRFLEDHPSFRLEDPRPHLPSGAHRLVTGEGYFLSLPSPAYSMDGFFAARLRRASVSRR